MKPPKKDNIKINITQENDKNKKVSSSTLMKDIEKNKIPVIRSRSVDVHNQVLQAGKKKKQFVKQIKGEIKEKKKSLMKSNSTALARMEIQSQSPKIGLKKQKSLLQLSRNLNERIHKDREARAKLEQISDEQKQKKIKLEKRINQINKRNQYRIKQLFEFQEKYLKKINNEYQKDKEKQEKLLQEYENVMHRHGKIKETQNYRKAIEKEDWQEIMKQKQKLEKMIKQYQRKQDILLKEQNPEILENIKEEIRRKQASKQVKTGPIEKLKQKGDAKKMGNQYLQYAKKLKQPKQKKIKLLDVNLKCIDYEGEMMHKIARNTGDLSKFNVDPTPSITVQSGKFKSVKQNSSFKLPVFELKQDEETKKYLSEIRTNLKELEGKNKKNQEGNNNKILLNSINQEKQ